MWCEAQQQNKKMFRQKKSFDQKKCKSVQVSMNKSEIWRRCDRRQKSRIFYFLSLFFISVFLSAFVVFSLSFAFSPGQCFYWLQFYFCLSIHLRYHLSLLCLFARLMFPFTSILFLSFYPPLLSFLSLLSFRQAIVYIHFYFISVFLSAFVIISLSFVFLPVQCFYSLHFSFRSFYQPLSSFLSLFSFCQANVSIHFNFISVFQKHEWNKEENNDAKFIFRSRLTFNILNTQNLMFYFQHKLKISTEKPLKCRWESKAHQLKKNASVVLVFTFFIFWLKSFSLDPMKSFCNSVKCLNSF